MPPQTARPGSTFLRVQQLFFGTDHANYAAGFQDFTRSIAAIKLRADSRREKFNWQVYWVAALGFLTDSYNLFASNVVLPALSYVYWDSPTKVRQNGFNIATLLGSMLGQVAFGVAVDVFGRKALYGFELLIVIISTLGLLQCSSGYRDEFGDTTWSITTWLFCWRVVMGIGIGAEYPLSACIASEWSSKHSRARMMAAVFLMQPLGQLLAYAVGLITISKFGSSKLDIDTFWRIVIGVGAIPTLAALVARFFLPESWRFTFFVTKNPGKAVNDSQDVYPRSNTIVDEVEMLERPFADRYVAPDRVNDVAAPYHDNAHLDNDHVGNGHIDHNHIGNGYLGNGNIGNGEFANGNITNGDIDNGDIANGHITNGHTANGGLLNGDGEAEGAPVQPAIVETPEWEAGEQFRGWLFWHFLWENRARMAGTSLCWFLLDIAFYGMGFNSPGTLAKLWTDQTIRFPDNAPWWQTNSDIANVTASDGRPVVINGLNLDGTIAYQSIDEIIKSTTTHALYTTSIAAILGSLLFISLAHLLNRRKMLIWTFFAVAAVLAVIAGTIKQFFHDGSQGARYLPGGHFALVALWALAQFLFNFGPNTLTFILPAEVFPTRYRCTCYGIAAAMGKLGAVVVQGAIWAIPNNDANNYVPLQWLMASFSVCMLLGGLVAMIPGAIPDVQGGPDGLRNKSLEKLSDDGDLLRDPDDPDGNGLSSDDDD